MIIKHSIIIAGLGSIIVCACATPTVVQSIKPGDNGLSCAQLQNEYVDAEHFRAAAAAEKTVTGGNVVRALLFWPAILGTASNANEAIAAADSRKVHLANQMSQKNCSIPITPAIASGAPSKQAQTTDQPTQSKEAQLTELKKLHDASLISDEVFTTRQNTILESPSN